MLILYFSAEKRKTADIAELFADYLTQAKTSEENITILEIKPEQPYTPSDLRYLNPLARCNREKFANKQIPISSPTKEQLETSYNWKEHKNVFIGFPIWYGGAPNIINSFCSDLDWSGKRVFCFATSKMSGIGKTAEKLRPFLKGAETVEAKRVKTVEELKEWWNENHEK